jgi:hypothetical protein
MVLLTEEIENSDTAVVTLMQTVRLLTVVFIVPFIAAYGTASIADRPVTMPVDSHGQGLVGAAPGIMAALAGAIAARLMKLPTPYLLGPTLGAAAAALGGYSVPPVPRELLRVAQIFFGIFMGARITLDRLKQLGKLSSYAIGGAVVLVAFTFILGFGLTLFSSTNLLTAFLSTAPGGMAEMGVTAVALHADIATVLAYQSMRLFSILILVPPLLKWWFNRCKMT